MSERRSQPAGRSQKSDSVSGSWDELSERVDRLRNDLAGLQEAVGNLARAGVTEGRERVMEQIDELTRRSAELGEEMSTRGRRAAEDVRRQAGTLSRDLEDAINRNPITAVLIALGLGFIIGASSRRG